MTEYRTLNPVCMKSMRIGYLVVFTAMIAGCAICAFMSREEHDVIYGAYGFGSLALVMLVLTVVFPRIYFDHYRYFISEDRVDVRSGIFFLRHKVIPIERIHQVEVVSGPVNRLFDLADVRITTAGGTADIEYLEREEAEKIADELNETVDRIVRGQRE